MTTWSPWATLPTKLSLSLSLSLHYTNYVLGSKPNLLTSLLHNSCISLNSLDAIVECRA